MTIENFLDFCVDDDTLIKIGELHGKQLAFFKLADVNSQDRELLEQECCGFWINYNSNLKKTELAIII